MDQSPPELRARLLGTMDLRLGGQQLPPLDSARAESLLAYLLLHRGAPQPRQHLAFLLWPGSAEGQAHTNLRKVLHILRRALPSADRLINIGPRTLQWRADAPVWLDAEQFERALAGGLLEEAVELYAGELLEGRYDEWLAAERERLARQHERNRRWPEAIRCAERLVAHDPLREEAHRLVIRLCRESGDRARAVRTYHACAATLERELGIGPAPGTRVLYQSLVVAARRAPRRRRRQRSAGEEHLARRPSSGAPPSWRGCPRHGVRRHPGVPSSCSSPARRASARHGWSTSSACTDIR